VPLCLGAFVAKFVSSHPFVSIAMKCFSILILLLASITLQAQIKVSDNHRFLTTANGDPFFWLGDTSWELFHRLTREEIDEFLDIRKQQGFNVIQAVALAEFNGIRQPNRYGDLPLNNEDPTQLLVTPGGDPSDDYQYDYWDHVDYAIGKIEEKGMFVGLLPTWGDKVAHMWGDGPIIFNERNAATYAETLATRYKDRKNIIWILGGDRPAIYSFKRDGVEKQYNELAIWRAMGLGLESVLGKEAFITYHTYGGNSSSKDLHNESWLDMNSFQSGHGARETESWTFVKNDLALHPPKPVLDMEPCYEDHPVNPWDGKWTRAGRGYFTAYDVRARIYRSVFAGGCGVTYGHHHIWQFLNKDLYEPINTGDTIIGWRQATRAQAAGEMQYLKALMLSRPFISRIPDQSMIKNPGKDYRDLVVATRDEEGTYAMIYLPQSRKVEVDLSKLNGMTKNVWWFDPRTGSAAGGVRVKGKQATFTPPSIGQDWILVIDDATAGYPKPGIPGR
jgi:hypothetical protein